MGRLALSRSVNESIVIRPASGEPITVTVTRLSRRNVRLVIEAPASVQIDRAEVAERKQLEVA